MTIYAVGDIQGCLKPLLTLLNNIDFNPQQDMLWVVGDMVNRGPESLKTLRFLYHLRHCVCAVLGNHDLHLLAAATGHRQPKPSDTLADILRAPDRDILLEWLRQLPLMHHDARLGYTMVHAGIPPQWSIKEALSHAAEVENVLRGESIHRFLKNMYGNKPAQWDQALKNEDRWRAITNYFTRMRFCTPTGKLELKIKAKVDAAPVGYLPWYAHKGRKTESDNIIFGHWAALRGNADHAKVFALDTGCVWGDRLTIMRLMDRKRFSVANHKDAR